MSCVTKLDIQYFREIWGTPHGVDGLWDHRVWSNRKSEIWCGKNPKKKLPEKSKHERYSVFNRFKNGSQSSENGFIQILKYHRKSSDRRVWSNRRPEIWRGKNPKKNLHQLQFTNDILFLKLSKTVHGARRTVVHKPLGEEGGSPSHSYQILI